MARNYHCLFAILTQTLSTLALAISLAREDTFNPTPYDPGFPLAPIIALAQSLPSHSWEYGTAVQALLELYTPSASVFNDPNTATFPIPSLDVQNTPALQFARAHIAIGRGADVLAVGDGAVGDPASLGVGAVLLGAGSWTSDDAAAQKGRFWDAAGAQVTYLLVDAPRYANGAISQRVEGPELWADFMYMAPPFLAYYGAATRNASVLQEAVRQCELYRDVLGQEGLWQHIVGPYSADAGYWSTGNGWAAAGMTRVLATVIKAPAGLVEDETVVEMLTGFIQEILDAIIAADLDGGLVRNYVDRGFGEAAGSALLASVVYRMAVLVPEVFAEAKYIEWAEGVRRTLGTQAGPGYYVHIAANGTVAPTVNPLAWTDPAPFTAGSPEAQSFALLMYAGWRDCVETGICSRTAASIT